MPSRIASHCPSSRWHMTLPNTQLSAMVVSVRRADAGAMACLKSIGSCSAQAMALSGKCPHPSLPDRAGLIYSPAQQQQQVLTWPMAHLGTVGAAGCSLPHFDSLDCPVRRKWTKLCLSTGRGRVNAGSRCPPCEKQRWHNHLCSARSNPCGDYAAEAVSVWRALLFAFVVEGWGMLTILMNKKTRPVSLCCVSFAGRSSGMSSCFNHTGACALRY